MHSLLPENLSSIRELWSCPGVRCVPQRRHFRESLDVYVTVSKKRLLVSGRSVSSPEMPEWRARFRTHLKNMCIFALLLCRKAVTHRWHVNCKMSLWEEGATALWPMVPGKKAAFWPPSTLPELKGLLYSWLSSWWTCIKFLVVWGLDIIGDTLFLWNQSMLKNAAVMLHPCFGKI